METYKLRLVNSDRVALVDAEYAWLAKYRWRLDKRGYVFRHSEKKITLHRQIIRDVPTGYLVDHINRDRLDNRAKNLRLLTPEQSAQNRGSYRGSTSRYRGVFWDSERQRWAATVGHNGRNYHQGRFDSEEEVAFAAQAARRELLPFSNEDSLDGPTRTKADARQRAPAERESEQEASRRQHGL